MINCRQTRMAFLLCFMSWVGFVEAYSTPLDSLKSKGTAAYYRGNFDIAENNFNEILKYHQNNGDIEEQIKSLIWIAEIRRAALQFELAQLALEEASKKIDKGKIKDAEINERLLNRKAAVLYEMGEIRKAVSFARNSIGVGRKAENGFLANNYNILGASYQKLEKYDSAYFFLKSSLNWSILQKDTDNVVSTCINLNTHFLNADRDCDSALYYARKALHFAKEAAIASRYYVLYDMLSRSLECKGLYKEALEAKKRESVIKDELRDRTVLKRIQSLSSMKSLEYEKKENSLLQEKIQNRNITLLLGSLFILVILITLGVELKRRKKITSLYGRLESQKKELEQANDLKNTMFSVVAHDLRNPLSTLSGVLNMLKAGDLGIEESKYLLERLSSQLLLTELLLDNLLKWSRAQMDGLTISKEPTDVTKLIEAEVSIVNEMAKLKQIEIKEDFEENLITKVDPQVLRFIVRNLLTNAIKFSKPKSKIWVSSRRTPSGLRVEVIDEGIGIPKEKLSAVFTDTVKSTYGTKKEKGSGLGLVICNNFITEHGGSLQVESEEGKGSKFTLEMHGE